MILLELVLGYGKVGGMKRTPSLPSLETVLTTTKISRHSGSGMSCSFYKITKTIGVKLFHNLKRAKMTHAMHVFVMNHSKYGKAVPKVYGEIFQVGERWGYFVQIVKIGWDVKDFRDRSEKAVSLAEDIKVLFQKEFTKWRSWFRKRDTWLKYLRNVFNDTHGSNWGVHRGNVVWLDLSYY